MAVKIEELYIELSARMARLEKDLKKSHRITKRWQRKMSFSIGKVRSAFYGVSAAMTAIPVSKAVRNWAQYRYAISDVQAKTGATKADIEDLSLTLRRHASETVWTAKQVSQAATFLAQAGLTIKEIEGFIRPVLDIAAAGGADVVRTADIVTSISRAMGIADKDLARTGDILVTAINNSKTNLYQLGESMKYAAPLAEDLNMNVMELSAVLGVMADAGHKGTVSGTAFRRALGALSRGEISAEDATSGTTEKLARQGAVLRSLGVSVKQAGGSLRPFVEIMWDLRKAGAGADEFIDIFGQIAGPKLAALIKPGRLERLEYLVKMMRDSAGAAKVMAAIRLDNLWGDMLLAVSVATELNIAFFDNTRSGKALRKIVQELTLAMRAMRESIIALGNAMPDITAGFMVIGAFLAGRWGISLIVRYGMALIRNIFRPITIFAASVALLNSKLHESGASWKSVFLVLYDDIKATLESSKVLFAQAWDTITSAIPDIITKIGEGISNFFKKIFEAIAKAIEEYMPTIEEKAKKGADAVKELWKEAGDYMQGVLDRAAAMDKGDSTRDKLVNALTGGKTEEDPKKPKKSSEFGKFRKAVVGGIVGVSAEMYGGVHNRWEQTLNTMAQASAKYKKDQEGLWTALGAGIVGTFEIIAKGAGKNSRRMAKLMKTVATLNVIVSTASAIMTAMRDFGWPAGLAVSALIAAMGAAQLAAIRAQPLPQAHGGLESVPRDETYLLRRGERVLAPDQNKQLMKMMRGQGGQGRGVNVSFTINAVDQVGVEDTLRRRRRFIENTINAAMREKMGKDSG